MRFYMLTILMVVGYLVPTLAFAQLVPCNGVNCNFCHLLELVDRMLTFIIKFSTVLAGIAFAWAGFLMITAAGNMSQIQKGKGIFSNVLIGFIIMLAAWLIIDTILSMLVDQSFLQTGGWNTLKC